jgi:hypothetical protein
MQPSLASASCKAVAAGDAAQLAVLRRLEADLAAAQDRIAELEDLLGQTIELPAARLQRHARAQRRHGRRDSVLKGDTYGREPDTDAQT